MISKLLTGGIDLPELASDVRVLQGLVFSARGVLPGYEDTLYASLDEIPTRFGSLVERIDDIDDRIEETNEAMADHIAKANFRLEDMGQFALTRASADDLAAWAPCWSSSKRAGKIQSGGVTGYLAPATTRAG